MGPAGLPLVRYPRRSTGDDTPWNPQPFVSAGDQGVNFVAASVLRLAMGISHVVALQECLQARIIVQPNGDGTSRLSVSYMRLQKRTVGNSLEPTALRLCLQSWSLFCKRLCMDPSDGPPVINCQVSLFLLTS